MAAEAVEDVVDAIGIGVVEEGDGEFVFAGLAEGVGDELWAEGGAADADHEEFFEFTLGAGDGARVDLGGKIFDRSECGGDRVGQLGRGRELRRAEPVVADHALLVGIRDGTFFEGGHGGEGLLHGGFLRGEKIVGEREARDIEGDAEVGVMVGVGFKA